MTVSTLVVQEMGTLGNLGNKVKLTMNILESLFSMSTRRYKNIIGALFIKRKKSLPNFKLYYKASIIKIP